MANSKLTKASIKSRLLESRALTEAYFALSFPIRICRSFILIYKKRGNKGMIWLYDRRWRYSCSFRPLYLIHWKDSETRLSRRKMHPRALIPSSSVLSLSSSSLSLSVLGKEGHFHRNTSIFYYYSSSFLFAESVIL